MTWTKHKQQKESLIQTVSLQMREECAWRGLGRCFERENPSSEHIGQGQKGTEERDCICDIFLTDSSSSSNTLLWMLGVRFSEDDSSEKETLRSSDLDL